MKNDDRASAPATEVVDGGGMKRESWYERWIPYVLAPVFVGGLCWVGYLAVKDTVANFDLRGTIVWASTAGLFMLGIYMGENGAKRQ